MCYLKKELIVIATATGLNENHFLMQSRAVLHPIIHGMLEQFEFNLKNAIRLN